MGEFAQGPAGGDQHSGRKYQDRSHCEYADGAGNDRDDQSRWLVSGQLP
jgi:hypothetical protein